MKDTHKNMEASLKCSFEPEGSMSHGVKLHVFALLRTSFSFLQL